MDNETLVGLIQNHIDEAENMKRLWEQNRGLICTVAKQYGSGELEDLQQEGFIGLCNAVPGYDPDKGVPFVSYAIFWIKNAMQRYLEEMSGVSSRTWNQILKYKRIRREYIASFGREATEWEIQRLLGVSVKEYDNILKGIQMSGKTSLNATVSTEEDTERGDLLPDGFDLEGETLDRIQNEELSAVLWPLVDDLPDQQPELLRSMYLDGLSTAQAAERAGIEAGKARTQVLKAYRALRRGKSCSILKPFLPERMGSLAYIGGGVGAFNRTWCSSTERAALWELERY